MQHETIRVGLVGVTGYTGMELARLLTGHPNMKLTAATSRTEAGKRLGDLYPKMDTAKLQELMARAIMLATIMGESSAREEADANA